MSPAVLGPLDVAGGPRIVGAAVDLGASERSAGASVTEVPVLGPVATALLALALAGVGWVALRRR